MRAPGTGGITKLEKLPRSKCRKWRLRVQTKHGEKTRRFSGTYTQANEELAKFIEEVGSTQCDYTFSEYADEWIRQRERTDLDKSTLYGNRSQIRALNIEFSEDMLILMNRRRIQDGLANIQEGNNASGKKLSNTTLHKLHSTMSKMFRDAYIDGIIPKNPMEQVRAPRPDVREKDAATPQDVVKLLKILDQAPYDAHCIAIKLAVLAGLRRSEIVGLEWRHYDGSTIIVCQSVRDIDGEVKATKSRKMRRVPVMPLLAEYLRSWSYAQKEMLEYIGVRQCDSTPIVTSDIGSRMAAQNLERWWRNHREEFGLSCTLHGLRHTFLTMLANSGAPIQTVKSVAGWSDISMANIYVHTDDSRNADAISFLGSSIVGTNIGTSIGTSIDAMNVSSDTEKIISDQHFNK